MVKLTIPKWVIALLVVSMISGIVLALEMFGQINISYVILSPNESASLSPNPIQLDLGTIYSGATGIKDFGYVGEMTLPATYHVTFELDSATIQDFTYFKVSIEFRDNSTNEYVTTLRLDNSSPSDGYTFSKGTYKLHITVNYIAKSITSTTSGTINISMSASG